MEQDALSQRIRLRWGLNAELCVHTVSVDGKLLR